MDVFFTIITIFVGFRHFGVCEAADKAVGVCGGSGKMAIVPINGRPSQTDVAAAIAEATLRLRDQAKAADMGFLAYLIDMAREEAESLARQSGRTNPPA